MSSSAVLRPALPREEQPERRLQPLAAPARRRRPKLAYALIALGGAAAIGVAQIGLSMVITHDSYTLASLTSEQNELTLQTQALKGDIAGFSSPQYLADNAAALGMVVAGSPSQLRLSDGAVLGSGQSAGTTSTVDPQGSGAVANSLLDQTLRTDEQTATADTTTDTDAAAAESTDSTDAAAEGTDGTVPTVEESTAPATDLPPALTEGLPSPTTH